MSRFKYGDNDADTGDRATAYALLLEHLYEQQRQRQIAKIDTAPMPFLRVLHENGSVSKYLISATESFMTLGDGERQLSAKSPIGEFVLKNKKLQPGAILPNGALVLECGMHSTH